MAKVTPETARIGIRRKPIYILYGDRKTIPSLYEASKGTTTMKQTERDSGRTVNVDLLDLL